MPLQPARPREQGPDRVRGRRRHGPQPRAGDPIPGPFGRPDPRSFRTVSITVYVTAWCQYCRKARAYLAAQPNLNVVIHDIEEDKARRAESLKKSGGDKGIPVIDVEGRIIVGFSASSIDRAIANARSR